MAYSKKEYIPTNAVGDFHGQAIGVVYIGQQTYFSADGTSHTDDAYTLEVFGGPVEAKWIVGRGSRVMFQYETWEACSVDRKGIEFIFLEKTRTDAGALDWYYWSECPLCGRNYAWTGGVEKRADDIGLIMACSHCDNQSLWVSGALQTALLYKDMRCFPGRLSNTRRSKV